MSLLPMDNGPLAAILGQSGPSWLTQQARANPFGLGQGGGLRGLLGDPNFALQLLANSGPSPQKRSFGQILGTSALQAQQMGQQQQDSELDRAYRQAQIEAMKTPRGQNEKLVSVIGPDGKPIFARESEAVGKTPYAGGSDSRPSAFIQAYDRYLQGGGKLGVMEFAKEFAASNAQYPYQLGTIAGEETLVPRTNPGVGAPLPTRKLSTLGQEAQAKNVLASAGAAGAETGQSVAKAQFDLPRVEGNVATAIGDIEKLKNHKGLPMITGLSSKIGIVPGTDQAAADALATQVQGQTFLQAFNSLKGGGAITEIESTKAEQAIARLSRAQSTKDYQAALDDLRGVLERGLEKAKKQARATGGEPTKIRKYNPATGRIE